MALDNELKTSVDNLKKFILDHIDKEITFLVQAEFNALYNEYSCQIEKHFGASLETDETLKKIEELHNLPKDIEDKYLDVFEKLEMGFFGSAPTLFQDKN